MSKINFKNLSIKYFNYFENKDLENLSKIISTKINLTDWENRIEGKKNFLLFNKKFFKETNFIKIKILNIHIYNNICFCEILVTLNKKIKLNIIDVLTFNNKGLIKSIRAFLGSNSIKIDK